MDPGQLDGPGDRMPPGHRATGERQRRARGQSRHLGDPRFQYGDDPEDAAVMPYLSDLGGASGVGGERDGVGLHRRRTRADGALGLP